MTEIVNLRIARKRKARAERESEAAANRAKHGTGKAERALRDKEIENIRAILDGAKRDDAPKKKSGHQGRPFAQ